LSAVGQPHRPSLTRSSVESGQGLLNRDGVIALGLTAADKFAIQKILARHAVVGYRNIDQLVFLERHGLERAQHAIFKDRFQALVMNTSDCMIPAASPLLKKTAPPMFEDWFARLCAVT
jgi:hypothetical protein